MTTATYVPGSSTARILSRLRARPRPVTKPRAVGLDRIRGLAVALMVLDHLCELGHGPTLLRATVTRAAMPLFFVLAGHLVTRLRWRHLQVAVIGAALTVAVPWIDDPNVLTLYALGVVWLVLCMKLRWGPQLAVGFALTWYANRFGLMPGNAYTPLALWGLMALGKSLPREAFAWGDRLPRWLAQLGRYPVTVYGGHLLLLQLAFFGRLG